MTCFFFILVNTRPSLAAIFGLCFALLLYALIKTKEHHYPFLYGVGLTDGSLCSGNAGCDTTVALTHAPKFTADFLCV